MFKWQKSLPIALWLKILTSGEFDLFKNWGADLLLKIALYGHDANKDFQYSIFHKGRWYTAVNRRGNFDTNDRRIARILSKVTSRAAFARERSVTIALPGSPGNTVRDIRIDLDLHGAIQRPTEYDAMLLQLALGTDWWVLLSMNGFLVFRIFGAPVRKAFAKKLVKDIEGILKRFGHLDRTSLDKGASIAIPTLDVKGLGFDDHANVYNQKVLYSLFKEYPTMDSFPVPEDPSPEEHKIALRRDRKRRETGTDELIHEVAQKAGTALGRITARSPHNSQPPHKEKQVGSYVRNIDTLVPRGCFQQVVVEAGRVPLGLSEEQTEAWVRRISAGSTESEIRDRLRRTRSRQKFLAGGKSKLNLVGEPEAKKALELAMARVPQGKKPNSSYYKYIVMLAVSIVIMGFFARIQRFGDKYLVPITLNFLMTLLHWNDARNFYSQFFKPYFVKVFRIVGKTFVDGLDEQRYPINEYDVPQDVVAVLPVLQSAAHTIRQRIVILVENFKNWLGFANHESGLMIFRC